MGRVVQLRWRIRNGLWGRIAAMKFSTNQDLDVTRLHKDSDRLQAVPISQIFPGITIQNVLIGDRTPCDERYPRVRYLLRRFFSRLFMLLNRLYPPMVKGLPPIDANPQMALAQAYTDRHRRAVSKAAKRHGLPSKEVLEFPVLPQELNGTPDIGALAVQGPLAGYIQKVPNEDIFEWDLRHLDEYQPRPGLYRLGIRVQFQPSPTGKRLIPMRIESALGLSYPTDVNWALAGRLALCALSTHTSLIRHWNWVHLIGGEALSIVTRNTLPEHHPFCRLLWPHIFGTQASNRLCTESQLVRGGDFESVFSYSHEEMYRLFTDTVSGFDVQVWDPRSYAAKRGVLNAEFDQPTEGNLAALFDVMHRHTVRYLAIYYETDAEIRADRAICQWVEELHKAVPNGLPVTSGTLTQAALARLTASCLYLATVQHELVGAFLWNYQLWTHSMPARVARDGSREPLDVYQRLLNTNFMLNTPRAPLIADLTPLALPESAHPERAARAVTAFTAFRQELESLQQTMEQELWMPWKLYPKSLEVNINA
jgi:hypothetical protein